MGSSLDTYKPFFFFPLKTELVQPGWWKKRVRLTATLKYYSPLVGEVIVVPRGFVCDLASVPRLPVIYWLFGSTQDRPAVIHDFLYKKKLFPRGICDAVFLEAMKCEHDNMPTLPGPLAWPQDGWRYIHRNCMYFGVRLGGWHSYEG